MRGFFLTKYISTKKQNDKCDNVFMKTIHIIFLKEEFDIDSETYIKARSFFYESLFMQQMFNKWQKRIKIKDVVKILTKAEKKRKDIVISQHAISFYNRFIKKHEVLFEKKGMLYLATDNEDSWLLRIMARLNCPLVKSTLE